MGIKKANEANNAVVKKWGWNPAAAEPSPPPPVPLLGGGVGSKLTEFACDLVHEGSDLATAINMAKTMPNKTSWSNGFVIAILIRGWYKLNEECDKVSHILSIIYRRVWGEEKIHNIFTVTNGIWKVQSIFPPTWSIK